jgi:quercetin dioxygenase-like cupin family protein
MPKDKSMDKDRPYKYIESISTQLPKVPPDSIISQTLYQDERIKAVLFSFAPGQELSEHTASMSAILHILEGEGHLTLGKDQYNASPGTWVHMTPHLPHSLHAQTRVVMLLLLLKNDEDYQPPKK